MPIDMIDRFISALSPQRREEVRRMPPERQRQLALEWEAELSRDLDLDTLSELSPAAAESEAAARVMRGHPA